MALEDRKTRPIGAVMRLYQKQVDETLARKRLALQEAQISKQLELDPNYRTFDSNRHVVMDSDTFRDRISGEIFRIGDGRLSGSGPGEAGSFGGYAIDSFETGEDQYGVKNNFYEKNPERFQAHRAALAAQLSLDEEEITEEDLYEVGRAQSANMKERAARGDFDGMGFTVDGLDHSGSRSMARFDSPEMADIVTNGVNAAYGSKYNWRDILERVGEADPSEIPEGTRNPIKWTKDGLVAAARTVGDVTIDTLTLASVAGGFIGIAPLNDLAAALQRGKETHWTPLMDALASDKAVYMREMEQKFQQVVTEPLYKARKAKYLYQGNNRAMATVKAWLMGGADTLEYLKENPARLVDTAIESLPYMFGANITARIATKSLEKRMKAAMTRRGETAIRNGHMSATQQAAFHQAIAKKGMWASVGFTGVTEGLGNAASVYARIINMTPQQLTDSEPYQKRIKEGMSHEEALMDMANKGALMTFVVTGILAAAANKFSGAGQLEANLFRNIGKNVKPTKGVWAKTKDVVRPARQEGVEEFFQSGGGEIVGQHVAAAVTDQPELVSGGRSAAAAATGVAAGIVSGGAIGNVSNAGQAIKAGAKGAANLLGRDKVDSASVRKVRVKLADLTRTGKAVSKDKDGKVQFDRLGGDVNQTKTELGAIDKAAGGQTANNVLGLFKQKFSQIPQDTAALLPESTKLLVSEAEYLQREYERRYDEKDEKQVAELRKMKAATKILKQNFKQALPLVLHEVLNDKTLEEKERKQLVGAITGEAQVYGLNPDQIMLNALKGLKLPKNQSDSMADVIRHAGEAAGFSAQLIDTLTNTVQKANSEYKDQPLAKTIKQVAFDLMYGGTYTVNGRKKKSIGIFHLGQQMMEASREGKIETFNKFSKQYEALVRYKARQVAATEKFIELVEGGMDQKQARKEALNHAGLNKTAMNLWMDESGGLLRLLQQRREEVYIMAKHMNKLHKQWEIDRRLYGEEQWTKKQKALLHWVKQQPFVKSGPGLANLGLKVPGYDQEFLDKFIAHSGELQTALQKIAQIEHTNKAKVREEAKLAHRKKRYNHKKHYKRPSRDENVDPELGVNKLWWHLVGKLVHNTFKVGPKKGQANLAGTKQKPRRAPEGFNPLYELGKAVANRYILSEQENFKTVDEDGNEIKGTGRGDTWYFFEAADAVLRIYSGGVKSNAYKQFLRGYGDELRRRRGGDYEGIPSFEERNKLAPRDGDTATPPPDTKTPDIKTRKGESLTKHKAFKGLNIENLKLFAKFIDELAAGDIEKFLSSHSIPWELRDAFVKKYGWSVPTPEALKAVLKRVGNRTVYIPAAGEGLWAVMLRNERVKVVATDLNPNVSSYDEKSKITPLTKVTKEDAVETAKRTDENSVLLLSWPEMSGVDFARATLEAFRGRTVIYIGEAKGGASMSGTAFDFLFEHFEEKTPDFLKIKSFQRIHDGIAFYESKKPKTVTPTIDENDQRTIEILQSFVAELPAKLASLIAIELAPPDNSRKLARYNHGIWLNRKNSGEKPIVLYARNIRQSPRWKDGKLDFGKLIQWVIFHELSHSTVKRLFGSAAGKDVDTYRTLLLGLLIPDQAKGKVDPYVEKMLGNTKFLRQNMQWAPSDEWINAVIERIEKDGVAKTFRDMYEGMLKTGDQEGIDNMRMVLTKLVEESLMELAGAMWAHGMVPRDAFKALDAEYGTDFLTSKYVIPQQRTYQKMVDTLMQVLRQLYNAAFTLSRSWSEAGLAPFGHVKSTRPQSEQLVLQMMVAQKIEYFSGKPEGDQRTKAQKAVDLYNDTFDAMERIAQTALRKWRTKIPKPGSPEQIEESRLQKILDKARQEIKEILGGNPSMKQFRDYINARRAEREEELEELGQEPPAPQVNRPVTPVHEDDQDEGNPFTAVVDPATVSNWEPADESTPSTPTFDLNDPNRTVEVTLKNGETVVLNVEQAQQLLDRIQREAQQEAYRNDPNDFADDAMADSTEDPDMAALLQAFLGQKPKTVKQTPPKQESAQVPHDNPFAVGDVGNVQDWGDVYGETLDPDQLDNPPPPPTDNPFDTGGITNVIEIPGVSDTTAQPQAQEPAPERPAWNPDFVEELLKGKNLNENQEAWIRAFAKRVKNDKILELVDFTFVPKGRTGLVEGRFNSDTGRIDMVIEYSHWYAEKPHITGKHVWTLRHEQFHKKVWEILTKGRTLHKDYPSTDAFRVHEVSQEYMDFMAAMGQNEFVKQLARAKISRTEDTQNLKWDSFIAIEEALAEIAAAIHTGDWGRLEGMYRVKVSKEMKGALKSPAQKFVNLIRDLYRHYLGKDLPPSDAEVYSIIMGMYGKDAPTKAEYKNSIAAYAEPIRKRMKEIEDMRAKLPEDRVLSKHTEEEYERLKQELADIDEVFAGIEVTFAPPPTPKTPYTQDQLRGLRQTLKELKGYLSDPKLDRIPASQIHFSESKPYYKWNSLVESARDKNKTIPVRETLEEWEKAIEDGLKDRNQSFKDIEELENVNSEETQVLGKDAATILEGGTIETNSGNVLSRMINFAQRHLAPYLYKVVDHTTSNRNTNLPLSRQWRRGNRWTLEQVNDPENETQFLHDLRVAFRKQGLPTALSEMFSVAKEKSSNLLHHSLGVFQELHLKENAAAFLNKLGHLTARERSGFMDVVAFVNKFDTKFREMRLGMLDSAEDFWGGEGRLNRTPFKAEHHLVKRGGGAIWNPLQRYALQFFMEENGSMDPNIVAIMALEVGDWMATNLAGAMVNNEDIIREIFHLEEDEHIPDHLKLMGRQGTLESEAARAIGARIMQRINYNVSSRGVTPLMRSRMEMSFGAMAISVVKEMQLVESRAIPHSFVQAGSEATMRLILPLSSAFVPFIGYGEKGEDGFHETYYLDKDAFKEDPTFRKIRVAFNNSRPLREKLFGNASYTKEPTFEPVKEPPKYRSRTKTKIPFFQRAVMKLMNAKRWKATEAGQSVMNLLSEDMSLNNKLLGGFTDEEIEGTIGVIRSNRAAKAAGINRALQNARDWQETMKAAGKTFFHFSYKMISTGRFYIESNLINPQADKIHRFLYGMPEWDLLIDPTSEDTTNVNAMKIAIALGLDLKITHSLDRATDVSASDLQEMVDYLDNLMQNDDSYVRAKLIMKEALDQGRQLTTADTQELIDLGVMKEGMHSLIALHEYVRYEEAVLTGKSFTAQIALEVDGKTNGIAIGSLQTPDVDQQGKITALYYTVLAGTGIFGGQYSQESFKDYREDPENLDNYEGTASDTGIDMEYKVANGWFRSDRERANEQREWVQQRIRARKHLMKAVLAIGFLKLNRNLAKDPLMVSSYNAGILSVQRNLAKIALNNYYEELSDLAHITDLNELAEAMADVSFRMAQILYAGSTTIMTDREGHTMIDDDGKPRRYRGFNKDLLDKDGNFSTEFTKPWGTLAQYKTFYAGFDSVKELHEWRRSTNLLDPAAPIKRDEEGERVVSQDTPDFRGTIEDFNAVIIETYGKSMAKGIAGRITTSMRKKRGYINDGIRFMNAVSATLYNALVARSEADLKRNLAPQERERIMSFMRRKGWIASVRPPYASELDEYIEIFQTENVALTTGANIDVANPERGEARFHKERVIATNQFNDKGKPLGPKVQKGIGYGIFGMKMTWDVGVRGFVNLIHASDGSVMARILKGKKGEKGAPVLGVHDAIIGNPVDILKRSVEANEAFHEVQGNWDLGFEVARRMKDFIRLLNDDQYFTAEQRDEIYKAIAGSEKIEKDDGTDPTEQEKFQQWLAKFTFNLQENSRVRKEVFSKLKSINQFAIDKANFLLNKKTFKTILDSLSTATQGISLSVAEESHRLSKATQEALETIYANIEQGGDPGTAFIDALRGDHEQGVDFVQAVDIFWEVVTRHGNLSAEHTQKLRFLVGAIKSRSYRKWDKAKLTVRISDNEGDQVTYYPKSHVIRIPVGMNISEVGQRLIQGGIEAALHDQFRELERDPVGNDAILLDVYQRAIKWMLNNFEGAKAGKLDAFMTAAVFKAEAIKSAHDKVQGKDQEAINERAAIKRELAVHYLTTTQGYMTQDESGQVGFQVDEATLKVATEVFARALEGGTFRPIYHSSPRGVNTRRFNEEDSQKLTRQLAESILSQFFQEETLSTEEQQFLIDAGKPLLEALEHVDTILLNMVGGNPSGLNEGAFIETDNTILLETSDGTIGTPTEMSKQEALLHEMYHGILKVALKHSGFMRRVRKTFDIVDKKVQDGTITWKDMLADPANYTAIEEQIARERFDHIFKYRRGADGAPIDADIIRAYAEFLTIASTNYKFNRKLAGIRMKEEPYTFWKGTLFDTIMGLVQDLFNWLAGAATGQNKDVRHAVQRLSKDMIKIARRHRKVQLKRPDGGPVQTGLDWADRKILEKIASLNTANLQQWALRNSLPYQEFQRELENKDSELSRLIFAAKSMLASAASPDMDWSYFRDAMDSAIWGYKKDGTVYQLLQEILPWAKRNHAYIDILRKSQYLIDTLRQKTNEITRGSLIDMWGLKQDPMKTNVSEAISMVMLRTDLAALMGRFGLPQIAEFIMDPVKVAEAVGVLEQELERVLNSPRLMQHFQWQMDGLAWLMVKGTPKKGHFWTEYNAHNIVHQQGYLPVMSRGTLENSSTLVDLVDHIVSLKALLLVDDTQLRLARTRITSELAKGEFNGFFGTLPMVREYKAKALEKSFKGNPIHMWKGYVYEQFDEDKDAQWVKDTPRNRQVMEQAGYKLIATYPPAKYLKEIDAMLEDPQSDILLYVHSARGVNTYSKAAFSTTREQKRGFGIFDINFTLDIWEEFDPNVSAARTKSVIQSTAEYARMLNQQAMEGRGADLNQQIAVPLYDENGKVTDLRFLMTEKHKRQYLGKRERLEEIFPRMLASIEDRTNSKLINHEIVDLLFGEYLQFGNDPDHRFVIIGDDGRFSGKTALEIRQFIDELKAQRKIARQNYDREAARQLTDRIKAAQKSLNSKEMWDLFPKDTQIYAKQLFGGDFVYVRDEVHNMIFGFRKLSLANSGLFGRGKLYTAAHIAEKIWQEIIQWERFRIAVLKPQVVLGNIVSNIFVLLAHNVPPQYIYRKSIEAISNMRNYQVSVNDLGKLQNRILADKALNKNTSFMERKAARLDYAIRQNPAHELVEEGLFTSIVEEIAPDEQSSRKQAMQWLMDKGGKVLTGQASRSVGNVANELWMLPGSQTARLALMGTQYGDFVARYVQYSWDTQVKGKNKEDAMRDALSTFIYYNIPQNKYLQWMNDNGFFMFTKFFFRIQHITLRLLRHSPTRALGAFLFQSQHEYSVLGDTVGEYTGNIHRLYRKLDPNPVDNIIGGGTFRPNLFEWFQFAF